MTEGAIRAAVDDLYAAYASGDGNKVAALIDDDIDWVIHGPVEVFPFQGPRQGKAAVLAALGEIARDYALQHYTPNIIITEGDRAAVMSEAAFTQRVTGRVLRLRLANFLRFRNGRVVEFREFMDTFDATEQALGRWLAVEKAPSV